MIIAPALRAIITCRFLSPAAAAFASAFFAWKRTFFNLGPSEKVSRGGGDCSPPEYYRSLEDRYSLPSPWILDLPTAFFRPTQFVTSLSRALIGGTANQCTSSCNFQPMKRRFITNHVIISAGTVWISNWKWAKSSEIWKKQMVEKRVHSLWKSDDQERTHFLKMGVKEWAHSFFL